MCLSQPDKEGGSGNFCLKEQEMEDLRDNGKVIMRTFSFVYV